MKMHLFKVEKKSPFRGVVLSLLVFGVIAWGVLSMINQTGQKSGEEQQTLLTDALRRAAVTCYAAEGRYPPTLAYLVDHYGVIINEDRFIVRYDAFAENIMPDITVLEMGGEQADAIDEI